MKYIQRMRRIFMDTAIYRDIAERTKGDVYIGVVGPVRCGKSTFIKGFMESSVLPNIDGDFERERARDEMPQSAGGRTSLPSLSPAMAHQSPSVLLLGHSCPAQPGFPPER